MIDQKTNQLGDVSTLDIATNLDDDLGTAAGPAVVRPIAAGTVALTVGEKKTSADFELRSVVDGTAELLVRAESAAARFATALWVAASTLAKKPAFTVAATALGIGAIAETSKGALMPDGSNDAPYIALASQYAGQLVYFQETSPSGQVGYGSAVRINSEWALTAGHNAIGPLGLDTFNSVGNSPDFNDPLLTVAVSGDVIDPQYDRTFESPDAALIHFSSALPGKDAVLGPAPAVGSVVTSAGYGTYGTPSTGSHPEDGNSRGWNAPIVIGNPSDVSDTYYLSTDFDSVDNVPLNGKGLGGDSGGPVFDSLGDLVGINIAQQGNLDSIGTTVFLNLAESDTREWIENTTALVPEPGTLTLAGGAAIGLLLRRRRL
jgi:hypothetical protein